jgi:hypothetical protein
MELMIGGTEADSRPVPRGNFTPEQPSTWHVTPYIGDDVEFEVMLVQWAESQSTDD